MHLEQWTFLNTMKLDIIHQMYTKNMLKIILFRIFNEIKQFSGDQLGANYYA